MENNGNIRLFTFDDNDTSTGFINAGQGRNTHYINTFKNELKKFYDFENKLHNYIGNLIKEYVELNNGEPVFLPSKISTQDIWGDPGNKWEIYGFGLDESGEPLVFIIEHGCSGYDTLVENTPDDCDGGSYGLEVSGVANPYELIRIFVANADYFEEIGLPNIHLQ